MQTLCIRVGIDTQVVPYSSQYMNTADFDCEHERMIVWLWE